MIDTSEAPSLNFDELIARYQAAEPPLQAPFSEGGLLLRTLFRSTDNIAIKADRTSKSSDAYITKGADPLPPQLREFNSSVYILNPVTEEIKEASRNGDAVKLGPAAISKFQNFRFEYDDDGSGTKIDKVTQLQFIEKSRLPVTALLDTGNKSIHIFLSVDGIESLEEYRLIANAILARLPGFPDPAAIEPYQPMWLPGGRRSKSNEPGDYLYPRCIFAGTRVGKTQIYDWISHTPIKSAEFLTHLKTPSGVYAEIHDLAPDSDREQQIFQAVEAQGGKIVRPHARGWVAYCPFHNNKNSPSALVFANGYVKCHSSNCVGGGWIVPHQKNPGVAAPISWDEYQERARSGMSMEDIEEEIEMERDDEKHFRDPTTAAALLRNQPKIIAGVGKTDSTCMLVHFETNVDCRNGYLRFRSLGQNCYYGRNENDEAVVLLVFEKKQSASQLNDFISGCFTLGFLPTKPISSAVEEASRLGSILVCSLHDGQWGASPGPGDVEHLMLGRPSFWIKHTFLPSELLSGGQPRFRKLRNLVSPNAKQLSRSHAEALIKTCGETEKAAERYKAMLLSRLLKKDDAPVPLGRLAEAGVAVGFLIGNGFTIDNTTSKNSVSPTEFSKVLLLEEGRKKPIVTDSCVKLTGDRKLDLISIIETEIKQSVLTTHFAVIAPAGYGKTTVLQKDFPSVFRSLGLSPLLIARERVEDVIGGEDMANRQSQASATDGHVELLNRLPEVKFKIGQADYDQNQDLLDDDLTISADDFEPMDQIWWPEIEAQIEDYQELNRRPVVFGSMTYKESLCLRPDKKPTSVLPTDFCSLTCEFKTCRAHPDYRKKLTFAEVVIASHQAVDNGGSHTIRYTDNTKQEHTRNVIFDEKPAGVFREWSVEIKPDSVKFVEDIVALLSSSGTERHAGLIDSLNKVRRQLLRKLSDIKTDLKKYKGYQKAKSYVRLARSSGLLAMGNRDLYFALLKISGQQPTVEKSSEVSNMADVIRNLTAYDGPMIETFEQERQCLAIRWGQPQWTRLRTQMPGAFIVLDATAHLDPDYAMPGAPKLVRTPIVQSFPNMTIHSTSSKDVSASSLTANWQQKYFDQIQMQVGHIKNAFPGEHVLIVIKKDVKDSGSPKMEADLKARFSGDASVHINHFGNLKGSNEFRYCKHIIFANLLRWKTESYLLRAMYLASGPVSDIITNRLTPVMAGKSGIMVSKGRFSNAAEFRNPELEMLRLQYEVPDMIQTIMRTALRDDTNSEVHVWLPGSNLRKIGMLLDYFVDAKVDSYSDEPARSEH